MSRGHIDATHHRSVYADPYGCSICAMRQKEFDAAYDAEAKARRAARKLATRKFDMIFRSAAASVVVICILMVVVAQIVHHT